MGRRTLLFSIWKKAIVVFCFFAVVNLILLLGVNRRRLYASEMGVYMYYDAIFGYSPNGSATLFVENLKTTKPQQYVNQTSTRVTPLILEHPRKTRVTPLILDHPRKTPKQVNKVVSDLKGAVFQGCFAISTSLSAKMIILQNITHAEQSSSEKTVRQRDIPIEDAIHQCLLQCQLRNLAVGQLQSRTNSKYQLYIAVDPRERACLCDREKALGITLTQKQKNVVPPRNSSCEELALLYKLETFARRVENLQCGIITMSPPGTHKRKALASLPGSGNTWARHVIELMTGIFTGSPYGDPILFRAGFYGERERKKGTTIVVKEHSSDNCTQKYNGVGAILLMRSPYRATIADYKRQYSGKGKAKGNDHTGEMPSEMFKTGHFLKHAKQHLEWWHIIHTEYLRLVKPLLVVHYEQLQTDFLNQLLRIRDFLGVNVTIERLQCTVENNHGNFKRPTSKTNVSENFDPFPADLKNLTSSYILEVSHLLRVGDHPDIPADYMPS